MRKKYEILYQWMLTELTRLSDSDEAEAFSAQLPDDKQDPFAAAAEELGRLSRGMAQALQDKTHFSEWRTLYTDLSSFEAAYSTFPRLSLAMFKLFALLAEKLRLDEANAPLDEVDIDDNAYHVADLREQIPLRFFCFEGAARENNIFLFSRRSLEDLEAQLPNATLSPKYLYQILAALSVTPSSTAQSSVVVSSNIAASPAVDAFVRVKVLSAGKTIHSPQPHTASISIYDQNSIHAGEIYQQWNDVFTVLSEYNSRSDLLLKYLTIYHVIENLMFKHPIVKLERQRNGAMFSIRDFSRLHDEVDLNESKALQRLFEAALPIRPVPAIPTSIAQHVLTKWLNLVHVLTVPNINQALSKLGISFTFGDWSGNTVKNHLSTLVYRTRNSIVHNKATEFHLTYATLDATMSTLLSQFLLPTLEEITFSLISKQNDVVWYSNQHLKLYDH